MTGLRLTRVLAAIGVLLTLCPPGVEVSASATTDKPRVRLFSTVDRQIVGVGESFVFEIECYATPDNDREIAELKAAFSSSRFEAIDRRVSLLREEPTVFEETTVRFGGLHGDVPVVRLVRRLVFGVESDGSIELPAFEIAYAGQAVRTHPLTVVAYRTLDDAEALRRSVVPIVTETTLDEQNRRVRRIGSGFLVADDALVTSYHVIVDAARIRVQMPNGKRVGVKKIWSVDPVRDVAILYIDSGVAAKNGLQSLRLKAPGVDFGLAHRGATSLRQTVFTMGWPDGVQRTRSGLLLGSGQEYQYDVLWTSSNSVRPGDSGGPLLTENGEVLGVVSYSLVSSLDEADALTHVTVSTDPRPALALRMVSNRPRSLKWYRRQAFFDRDPHARAIKASTRLGEFTIRRSNRHDLGLSDLLNELDLTVADNPSEATLHYMRGTVYQMLGSFGQAADSYRETLRREKRHYPAAYSLAYCSLALRGLDQAEDMFLLSSEYEPYRYLAAYGLAQTRMEMLQYGPARDLLARIVEQRPHFAPALYLLGRTYVAGGDLKATAQLVAKLGRIDGRWASLLAGNVAHPLYGPVAVTEMPRADVRKARSNSGL